MIIIFRFNVNFINSTVYNFVFVLNKYDKFKAKDIGLQYSERIKNWNNLCKHRNLITAHHFNLKKARLKT